MILDAVETDGPHIEGIIVRADVFREEEVDALGAVWEEFNILGAEESGYEFFVDREGEAILGFACYGLRDLTDGVYDLYYLVVDPAARRRAVGRRLLRACEAEARESGARMMMAEISGASRCEATREFFQAAAYGIEATIKDFYSVGDDLLVYVKRF